MEICGFFTTAQNHVDIQGTPWVGYATHQTTLGDTSGYMGLGELALMA